MSDEFDFFKEDETTMIFDVSNMAFRALHAIIYASPTDNGSFELWKHTFINSMFSVILKQKPTKVILACDGTKNWRYDVYKEYKFKRKLDKEKSNINFEKFYEVFEELLWDIKNTFTNIVLLKEDRAEADDVIAVLTRHIKEDNIIIVSSDKDLNQLLIAQRIRQFKPITETFVESINPYKDLQLKILTGDAGDSVPPIRPKIGPKTACKILESGLEEFLDTDPILRTNYLRNKKLIDLSEIPVEITQSIINTFTSYPVAPIDPTVLFKFFNKHRLRKLMDQWNVIGNVIKGLNKNAYNSIQMEERIL